MHIKYANNAIQNDQHDIFLIFWVSFWASAKNLLAYFCHSER